LFLLTSGGAVTGGRRFGDVYDVYSNAWPLVLPENPPSSKSTAAWMKPNAEAINDRVKLLFHRLIARRLGQDPSLVTLARRGSAQRKSGARTWVG
jgi:hypothetical protein